MSLIIPPQKLGFTPNIRKSLYSWGDGNSYGVGRATNGFSALEITTVGNKNWYHISAGSHGMGVTCDGKLYGWGERSYGRMGDGTTTGTYSLPTQIGSDTNWKWVACSSITTFAVKKNGTLWATGNNSYGRLGVGDQTARSTWTQIGALDHWDKVYVAYNNGYFAIATTNTGKMYSWGRNNFGQLGIGTYNNSNSPIQIGNLTGWKNVAVGKYHALATRNGKLYVWGMTETYRSGVNSRPYGTPTDINVEYVTKVKTGKSHTVILKSNGAGYPSSMESTGYNPNYALNQGITTYSPGFALCTNTGSPYLDIATNYAATMSIIDASDRQLLINGRTYSTGSPTYRFYRGLLGNGVASSTATTPQSTVPAHTKCEKITFGVNAGFAIRFKK